MADIGIDATPVSIQGKGVSRRILEFLRALSGILNSHRYFIFVNSNTGLPMLPSAANFNYVPLPFPASIVWEQFYLPRLVKKYKLDILHTPYDRLPLFTECPVIAHLPEIPDYRRLYRQPQVSAIYPQISELITKFVFPFSLKKAANIIVSSKSTQNDLMAKYKIASGKIKLVYEAASPFFTPGSAQEIKTIRDQWNTPQGYVLHFASGDPRDNTETVLASYAKAMPGLDDFFPLVLVTRSQTAKKMIDLQSKKLGISHKIRHIEAPSESELLNVYRGAAVYFDPSLFEGFGLQVAEAMACGLPILASNVTSLPEVVGDAGILADPHDIKTFADALRLLFIQDKVRLAMSQKSISQAKKFSWQEHAKKVVDIYNEMCPPGRKTGGPFFFQCV